LHRRSTRALAGECFEDEETRRAPDFVHRGGSVSLSTARFFFSFSFSFSARAAPTRAASGPVSRFARSTSFRARRAKEHEDTATAFAFFWTSKRARGDVSPSAPSAAPRVLFSLFSAASSGSAKRKNASAPSKSDDSDAVSFSSSFISVGSLLDNSSRLLEEFSKNIDRSIVLFVASLDR
jgi:hypothetical protein